MEYLTEGMVTSDVKTVRSVNENRLKVKFISRSTTGSELVEPRIDKIDVSEDIVFYLCKPWVYHPMEYGSDQFRNAMLNAINLNRDRFCEFFQPAEKGGAGMQLLESEDLKKMYCENCFRN